MLSRVGCSEAQQGHGIWGALFSSGTGVHLAVKAAQTCGSFCCPAVRLFPWRGEKNPSQVATQGSDGR